MWLDTACRKTLQHILVNMHHGRIRVCIYIGHMVVSTVLGPPWSKEDSPRLLGPFTPSQYHRGYPLPSARESSWVFNEISGPSVPRPTPSSSSTMDKASQPAHCPYVLHGGRYRSLPVSWLFSVYTVYALAAQTHLRAFAGRRTLHDDYRKY